MILPWYELLMRPDADLRQSGIPARKIAELREEHTGHRRSLVPRWCRSIGLWGRIATQIELEHITGATPKATRRFSEKWGLKFAGSYGRTSQFQLAVDVYEDYRDIIDAGKEFDLLAAARRFYILPVEAFLYPLAVAGFCQERERCINDLTSSFSAATLIMQWMNSGWMVGLPEKVMDNIGGGDDRLVKRIHKRCGNAPATKLRRTT